jgi:hypothetical protein
MIDFLLSSNRVEQKSEEYLSLFHLIAKIRFNLDAIQLLLPSLLEDYRFKTSMNLLYRGVVSDLINTLYLVSWCDGSTEKQPLLSAELDILQIDFLNAVLKIVSAEGLIQQIVRDPTDNWEQEIIDANIDLYDEVRGSWKNATQIRKRTGHKYDIDPNLARPTETAKISHIGRFQLANANHLESSFRYLSQYQHFSPRMHDFLLSDPNYDIEVYKVVLSILIDTLTLVSYVVNYNNKEEFEATHSKLIEKFKCLYPPSHSPPQEEPPY